MTDEIELQRDAVWLDVDWYDSLVSDCCAIVTEATFNSRWELIVGYHQLGRRIATDNVWNARGNGRTLTGLSKSTGIGERDLYRAVQFYKKFPSLDLLPGGKNITWNKIIALLPEQDEAKTQDDKYIFRVTHAFDGLLKLAGNWAQERQAEYLADLEQFKKRWFSI